MVARHSEKEDILYSLRLYQNASPTMDECKALFCITLCQQLYIKDLLEDLRRQFPDILQSVIEPIRLSGDLVSLDVPSDVSGWTIVPDRHPPQFTRSQVDFPLTNPKYAQYSGTYPPRILLSIFPSSDQQLGQSSARSCSLKVEGVVEDLLTPPLFTLYFPRVISPTEAPATLHTPVSISISETEGGRVDKVLNESDLSIVLDVVKGAAPKWKNVGVYLGFLGSEVAIIAASPSLFHEAPLGYLRDLLSQWLRWSPPTHPFPTIGNLASALRRAGEEKMAFYLLPYYSEWKAEILKKELQEKDATVITIRGEVECLQKQLRESKDTNNTLDSEVKAAQAEIENLRKRLDEKGMEIVEKELTMQEETEGLKEQLQESHTWLQKKDSDIEHLHQNLREKEALMAGLEMEMESMKKDREARSEDRQSPAAAPARVEDSTDMELVRLPMEDEGDSDSSDIGDTLLGRQSPSSRTHFHHCCRCSIL